ncbi:MAG: peptide-N4-asparagine amidase, partial [Acidobacteriaceae bacterium]
FYYKTTVGQGFHVTKSSSLNGVATMTSSIREDDQATDTLPFDASGNFLGPQNSNATQSYVGRNSLGQCYSRTITASAQVLTSVTDGQGCGK